MGGTSPEEAGPPSYPTIAEIQQIYTAQAREYQYTLAEWTSQNNKYMALYNWISETVDDSLLDSAIRELAGKSELCIQTLVSTL